GARRRGWCCVACEDIVSVYERAVEDETMRGAFNACSPDPVTNERFTKVMGSVLYRATILPLPEFAVNFLFGEMGDGLLLDSTRATPKRLQDIGFEFKF